MKVTAKTLKNYFERFRPVSKYAILGSVALLAAFTFIPARYNVVPTAQAQTPPNLASTSSIAAYLATVARSKGADPAIADWVGSKEGDNFNPNAIGDRDFLCPDPKSPLFGQISPSYGLAQINRCYHPDVSVEQALDPVFAANWIADEIAKGNAAQDWTTYKNCREWFTRCPF